jgi:hypothetical protein
MRCQVKSSDVPEEAANPMGEEEDEEEQPQHAQR